MIPQRTLDQAIRCTGIGLHTGQKVEIGLRPAAEDTGIIFYRTDMDPEIPIPARAAYVVDTRLCTTLGVDGLRIATVEHLLSAMAGLGIDNAYVDIKGPEVPIMDGSSGPFVFLLQCAGIKDQARPKKVMRIKKTVSIEDGAKRCSIYPSAGFRVSYHLDYDHPMLRNREASIDFSRQPYTREVSRARTFGFLHEIEALQKAGLARGGSLENALVFDAFRIVNESGMRYENECARHKILDTVGDLSLTGYPIVGAFAGKRSGHEMNIQLVRKLLAEESFWAIEELTETHEAPGLDGKAAVQPA